MNAWELSDSEILNQWRETYNSEPPREVMHIERAIASAAVKKYQEWLASQCGPEPCTVCSAESYKEYCYPCEKIPRHEGQIQGYAKVRQREREIVEWIRAESERHKAMSDEAYPIDKGTQLGLYWTLKLTADDLEAWLRGGE